MDSIITIEGPGPLAEITAHTGIDWTKPVRTVSGKYPVKIYAIDHNLRMPVLGRCEDDADVCQWSYKGKFFRDGKNSTLDLENVPEVQP